MKKFTVEFLKKNLNHKKLKNLGFIQDEFIYVYIHPRCKYVVKNHWFLTRDFPKKNKYIVIPEYMDDKWMIQKKVNTDNAEEACYQLRKISYLNKYDTHSGNCGYLEGKPVLFDI